MRQGLQRGALALPALLFTGLLTLASSAAVSAGDGADRPQVSRQELLTYLANPTGFLLIDARSEDEFAAGHISGAVSLPNDAPAVAFDALPGDRDTPLVVYCRTGKRAAALKERLGEAGYRNVRTLQPGQIFWADGLVVFNCGADSGSGPLE